ncbi:hypothetical protein [Stagnihabitans tardus]|uniref:DoxX-like family protein n=1 Tax=Stagnihabitans tardus TaxID=2699202 RepID=A0AAE4YAY2_9RHOB|nr:hypothetical protein [Stagnihabitans tardus]NBZ88106.1 hypothetical protein [Stagnihabitans tardus]
MAARLFRFGLAVIFVAAGLALAFGYDRMGQRAEVLGLPLALRVPAGLWQVAAGVFLMIPGRLGYGALMGLLASGAAVAAHFAVLGLDSAPPALALAVICAVLALRHRADLRR